MSSIAAKKRQAADRVTEMDRILCLPQDFRTPEDPSTLQNLVQEYTKRLKKPEGQWDLFPVQALALAVLEEQRGLIGSMAVGSGKTLVTQLAPKILRIKPFKTVLFTRAKLIDSWYREMEKYRRHFDVEKNIYVFSYAKLSHPDRGPRLLPEHAPDLVIADEAHALASPDSCRRDRFERYFEDNPDTIFAAMSGTLTKTSIKDYAHLAKIALGDGTPLPRTYNELEAWSKCLDATSESQYAKAWQWAKVQPLNTVYGDGRDLTDIYPVEDRQTQARAAFYERISTTPGFVFTAKDSVGASIQIEPITDLVVPPEIVSAMRRVEREYILPNEDEIEDSFAKGRALNQLAQGVYYYWDWPGEPDTDWLDARREKTREIRKAYQSGPREIDSPALVRRKIAAGETHVFGNQARLDQAWEEWKPHRHKDPPPTRPKWMSEYLIDDAIRRAKSTRSRPPALMWYAHRFVADKLAERGVDVYWPEEDRNPEDADPADGPIALSIASHTEGLNLQYAWYRMLVLCPPTDAGTWEQMIGRIHREGQEEDTVFVEVYAHVSQYIKTLKQARANRGKYLEEHSGAEPKIRHADWTKVI